MSRMKPEDVIAGKGRPFTGKPNTSKACATGARSMSTASASTT